MKKIKIIDFDKHSFTINLPKPMADNDTITMTIKEGVAVSITHDRLINEWRKRRGKG